MHDKQRMVDNNDGGWALHSIAKFDEQSRNWDSLNDRGARSPLLTAIFFRNLLQQFGTGKEILAVRGSVVPTAMAVLQRETRVGWSTFQPSQAPLGAWIQMPNADTEDLATSLVRTLPGFTLALGISQVDPELVMRPNDTPTLQSVDYIQTSHVTVRGAFDDYWALRGKNLRHNLKRQRNQLARQGVECRLDTVTLPADVPNAIGDYARLETAGWKAGTGTAVRLDDAQGRFYTNLLKDYCAEGRGRIYRLWLDGRVAATDLCIDNGAVFVILKTSYDETITNVSPALLMREEYFRHLFEAGFQRIEFYGRLMDWHTKWSDEIRTLYHMNCYRSPVVISLRRILKRQQPT